jgi:hypothetical protein
VIALGQRLDAMSYDGAVALGRTIVEYWKWRGYAQVEMRIECIREVYRTLFLVWSNLRNGRPATGKTR